MGRAAGGGGDPEGIGPVAPPGQAQKRPAGVPPARQRGPFIWSPRPHAGAHLNTAGDTSQLYFGLTWTFDLTDRFWVAFGGGGAVHDGKLSTRDGKDLQLGSAALFRWTVEAGVTLAERHRLSVMLDHVSNAGLVRENVGLDAVGVRYGYRF